MGHILFNAFFFLNLLHGEDHVRRTHLAWNSHSASNRIFSARVDSLLSSVQANSFPAVTVISSVYLLKDGGLLDDLATCKNFQVFPSIVMTM